MAHRKTKEGVQEGVGVEEGVGRHLLVGEVEAQQHTLLLGVEAVEGQQNRGEGGTRGEMVEVGSPPVESLQAVVVLAGHQPSVEEEEVVQEEVQSPAGHLAESQQAELEEGDLG